MYIVLWKIGDGFLLFLKTNFLEIFYGEKIWNENLYLRENRF